MDGPRKAMGRDPDSDRRAAGWARRVAYCDECHGPIYEGDWPWCGGKGREGHRR